MTTPVAISEFQADYQDTDRSTAQTVKRMTEHVKDALEDPAVHDVAQNQIGNRGTRADRCRAVWQWLKNNIEFVPDEVQLRQLMGRSGELELLISPSVMVREQNKKGDCDCFVMTACALLASLGVPPLIKTFKCERENPGRWSHVCAAGILEDGSIFPVDASHGPYAGWQVPDSDVYDFQLWDMRGYPINYGGEIKMQRGLNGYVANPNWTGNEMTTTRGKVAGPYPSHDIMRAYYPGPRAAGLRSIGRAKYRGMGALVCQYDDTGAPYGCVDDGTGTSLSDTGKNAVDAPGFPSTQPTQLSGGGYTYNPSSGTLPAPSTGGALSSIFSSLLGSAATLTRQALATPGTTILPNGTVITGTPQGTSALGPSSMSPLLILGLVGLGVVLLAKK